MIKMKFNPKISRLRANIKIIFRHEQKVFKISPSLQKCCIIYKSQHKRLLLCFFIKHFHGCKRISIKSAFKNHCETIRFMLIRWLFHFSSFTLNHILQMGSSAADWRTIRQENIWALLSTPASFMINWNDFLFLFL